MKNYEAIVTCFATTMAFFLLGCADHSGVADHNSTTMQDRSVVYEIFVQSFCDSNGDGIGDLLGVVEKLDYIEDLGVGAIWLMPISPSPSYHKYDVTNYYDIHPDYGTLDDFKLLIREAHNRGIKVILDFVINHTSSEHPWFQRAIQDQNGPFRDFYTWQYRDAVKEQLAQKEILYDTDNISQWHSPDGDPGSEHYYGFFYHGMPDLNYDNPVVRKEIYDIGRFWLDLGVDGFRMDAAKYIYPEDRAEDNHAFWKEFMSTMKIHKSDVYLVGEVWADNTVSAPFYQGFNSLFNFDLALSIKESLRRGASCSAVIDGPGIAVDTSRSLTESIIQMHTSYKKYNPEFFDAVFLSNHDQNRIASDLSGDLNKLKMAANILMTIPGRPDIYYGEELAMLGEKPDEYIREPMIWSNDSNRNNSSTSWLKPRFSTLTSVKGVGTQISDQNSLLQHYKRLIELRNESQILSHGHMADSEFVFEGTISYQLSIDPTVALIIHNISSKEIPLPFEELKLKYPGEWVIIGTKVNNHGLETLMPYTSILLKT